MVSLSDLSDTLQASKMTVINHYKRLIKRDKDLKKESKKINNKRFFSNHLSKLIMKSFKVTRAKGSTLQNKDVLITKIHAQEDMLDNLRAESTKKDNQMSKLNDQVAGLNDSNKRLEKLLDQQQRLQLSTNAENKSLKQQIKHLTMIEPAKPSSTDTDTVKNGSHDVRPTSTGKHVKNVKHGRIWHLFHLK